MHNINFYVAIVISGFLSCSYAQPSYEAELAIEDAEGNILQVAEGFDFELLMYTGHSDNAERFGQMKDRNDRPLTFPDGSPYLCNGTNDAPGSGLDYTSILHNPDGSGKLYMVSQFECPIGAYYMSELKQDQKGVLHTVPGTLRYISQKAYHGGWVHCAGSKTPWESHLGSEEYEPDGRIIEQHRNEEGRTGFGSFDETAKYFGNFKAANPYYWGWVTEVKIEAGEPGYRKHYALGRFSHELAYVMPDERTVYMSDDGTNVGFYMFVADRPADLSSGTLYAARWQQQSARAGGSADLEWISLGHISDGEVRKAVDGKAQFSQMFDTEAPTEAHTCPSEGFGAINTVGKTECLKLRTDIYSEAVVSRLESRRYAALKGATTEFRKEEGITYDPDRKRLYVGMSSLSHGMLEDEEEFDAGGPDHIRLEKNGCGAVYTLNIAQTAHKDGDGNAIESEYVVADMRVLLEGTPKVYAPGNPYNGNECDVNGIANPDNLTYLPGSNLLVIGEDSRKHVNNMLWAYDVEQGTLRRMATLPEGAEATSPYWVTGVNGYDYLTLVVQHPQDGKGESYVGVFGPFKTVTP